MKIYTKTGDKGTTSLIGGTRVPKNDPRIKAYGMLDELNAQLGMLNSHLSENSLRTKILRIQTFLFQISAVLATDTNKTEPKLMQKTTDDEIFWLENEIDEFSKTLPDVKKFIIPGGNCASSCAQICRTTSRRAEIQLYDTHEKYPVREDIFMYINRLSDFLFVFSRYINIFSAEKEFFL